MTHLTRAHQELFRRTPDEHFSSLPTLSAHCRDLRDQSVDRWELPQALRPASTADFLQLGIGGDGAFLMNDWSFGQLCRLANLPKHAVNRLSPDTAKRVFYETLPSGQKPLQLLVNDRRVRSIHAASYTRLHNADLLDVVEEFASDFRPPQQAVTGGTGLYCGEQDMFCFLIDPAGWAEIDGQAFAPGFFIWNSEVGRRAVGIETFWFQAVCANHLVWDAVETVEFTRKHTANVHESLGEIRRIIAELVAERPSPRFGCHPQGHASSAGHRRHLPNRDIAELLKQASRAGRVATKRSRSPSESPFESLSLALVDATTGSSGNQSR